VGPLYRISGLSQILDLLPTGLLQAAAIGMTLLLLLCQGCGSSPPGRPLPGGRTVAAHAQTTIPVARADQHEARMLADALKKRPDHVPVLLRLAGLAMESGKPAEAEKYLNEVLTQEPGSIPARLDLGKIQFEAGRVPEAIHTTAEILKTDPDNADALYNLGAIYGNLGQRDRAIEHWGRLLASSPQSESGKRARLMMAELQRTTP
jgi:tetratricopeptide (TPR) repeat protein